MRFGRAKRSALPDVSHSPRPIRVNGDSSRESGFLPTVYLPLWSRVAADLRPPFVLSCGMLRLSCLRLRPRTGATDRSSPNKAERPSCVLHPGGTARTVWNLLVAVGVLHDLLMVPLYVFELPESGFLLFLEWTTMLFWNLDCVVSLRTGFYDQGSLVMSPWRIFLHYARSWLLFDASLVSLEPSQNLRLTQD